jgi:lipopolysaccharide/colanic/teichoic acid biosynthesis glycosyltransferase
MKRILDLLLSILGITVASPVVLIVSFLVWLQDFKNPIYVAERIGLNGKKFRMYKLRSMVIGADKIGASSASNSDSRITSVGKFIRKFKLDELCQLYNVLIGDMSLVGPRPNVMKNGVELYTENEMGLLSVRPGITDLASIVFSDEGTILKDSKDPDADYNKLIRPWKNRLGLLYINNESLLLDLKLIMLTVISIFNKKFCLSRINDILNALNADKELIEVCKREKPLYFKDPP